MEEAIKELGDDDLLELMETALKRIGEVTEMIRKRETRLVRSSSCKPL